MCFVYDSRPPLPPMSGAAVDSRDLELRAEDGTRFAAFEAIAPTPGGAGLVILPDIRGLHRYHEELALRLGAADLAAAGVIGFYGVPVGPSRRTCRPRSI